MSITLSYSSLIPIDPLSTLESSVFIPFPVAVINRPTKATSERKGLVWRSLKVQFYVIAGASGQQDPAGPEESHPIHSLDQRAVEHAR